MCGIVGYIGDKDASSILVNGLKKLEYRGYDSAGVAILSGNEISVAKCKGRLSALEERLQRSPVTGTLGIGHTRWATHGEPNDINSHPHLSTSGKIAVVHNGIIENYIKLKEFLQGEGFNFVSDTDTEVVAHLVEYHYKGDLVKAVIDTVNEIEGSYALGVICSDCDEHFVAARKDSPLIVGLGKGENFIASDIPAILEHTRDIYILEDKEVVVLAKDEIKVFNNYGARVDKKVFHVDWDVASAEKSGYEHFMMKEMCEEPKVIRDTISPRISGNKIILDKINISAQELEGIRKIFIVALSCRRCRQVCHRKDGSNTCRSGFGKRVQIQRSYG